MTATVSNHPISLSIERPALYVVATPIGNLGDISYRTVELLKRIDLLLVEDTRVTIRLLQRYSITSRSIAMHEHNEGDLLHTVIQDLVAENLAVALLSDAGTPLISDPGFRLVRAAHEHGVPVRAVPGPCAAVAALSVAGIPSDRFVFEGFLPARKAARGRRLQSLVTEPRTLIFYEAPHRILATMADLCEIFGHAREVAVARELTKLHETLYRGSLSSVAVAMNADPNAVRGEIVIVVAGAPERDTSEDERRAMEMIKVLSCHLPRGDAVRIAAELTGLKRNHLYRLAHNNGNG
ncbi:MAG: 16S rRNA (cytidine(1402)-2'-O)-methyltransferase [Proteobacteria bacterium]|nr:MAG: 16S rRNA (cytidine(1402)-2'-O)-methyltransferase [Pseudomonadota bacterium]